MKNWFTVEPDVTKPMNKHYTPGRGGAQIEYITRHHLAGIATTEQVWGWWQNRQASAHYVVENSGRIGQLVWDRDTAWSNASTFSNQRSIAIEHSNSTGLVNGNDNDPRSWNINETVIREGARLAAALCWYYKLGRPVFGRNVRDHREFGQTSCPHYLAKGGKYHDTWMRIAQEHYDWMAANPSGIPPTVPPAPAPKEEITVAEADRIINELKGYIDARLTGPVGGDTKDIRAQLTGSRDSHPGDLKKSYPGWDVKALVESARKKGFTGLTVTEMCALTVGGSDEDLAAVRKVVGGQ